MAPKKINRNSKFMYTPCIYFNCHWGGSRSCQYKHDVKTKKYLELFGDT
jgi:hypothetical protein